MPRQLPAKYQTDKLHVEPQVGETDGRFWLTVTLTKGKRTWTSQETTLVATDWNSAMEEAAIKVTRLIAILGSNLPGK